MPSLRDPGGVVALWLALTAWPSTPGAQRPPTRAPATSDLLHCDLELRAYELGVAGDSPPSAPVLAGDGVLVAFTRERAGAGAAVVTELLTQRLDRRGALAAPSVVRTGVPHATPRLAAAGGAIRLVAGSGPGVVLLAIEPGSGAGQTDAPAVSLPFWPEDLTAGPRGVVATHSTREHRFVWRESAVAPAANVVLPPSETLPEPQEQLVASGPRRDLVLVPTHRAVGLATLTPDARTAPPPRELFARTPATPSEVSIAAGPAGFAVVRNGPAPGALTLLRFDPEGAPVGLPTVSLEADPTRPRRHPRVTPLGRGWAVSYWDGVGPSIIRFDADGSVIGRPVPVRSGDERGGHTDARMVASEVVLAVSWDVHEPEFSHGVASERPRRPGPRLGVLRCRASVP